MPVARRIPDPSRKPKRPPAKTPEARQRQMMSYAEDLAEEQLLNGTASAQVITHYLKLATIRERLEQEKLSRENELLKAKQEQIKNQERDSEMYQKVIDAMRTYSGHDAPEDEDYYDD